MTSLSVKQKALIYLNRYRSIDSNNIYNIPWELTQDGVANALCISRAHASIVLNQLRDEDLAIDRITHVKNGKSKRKSYFITPLGIEEAAKLIDLAAKNNIDISMITESKRKSAEILTSKLSKEDRMALGCACAFNMPVPIESLPKIHNFSIPTDVNGNVIIDDELRQNMMQSATDIDRADWHGFAANYWMDIKLKRDERFYESIQELLYHMVESGRNRDACKLISSELYYFVNSIDDLLHDTIKKVRPVDKYEKDVLILSLEVCLEYDELDETKGLIDRLSSIDSDCASTYVFDVEMKKGDRDAAKAAISGSKDRYPIAKVRWASLLREERKNKEARELLNSVRDVTGTELDNFQLEKYIELARLDSAEGHDADAYQRLSKVRSTVNNKIFNRKFKALEKELKIRLEI